VPNVSKVDQLYAALPGYLNAKTNKNWSALVNAIGQSDENIAKLVAAVRQQFFVKTASRPYLDRLAANSNVSRPKFLGMDDPTFQRYIPILSYQPKQVKSIIDQLLNIFFNEESTTAYVVSGQGENYSFRDGWELQWLVDGINQENVVFHASDFLNITSASAAEVAAAINRQTVYSYAVPYYDNLTKNTYIELFTNTIGSKGSIMIQGGRANIALQFNGFNINSGNGTNTQWTVSKVGQTTTFTHTGGSSPNISGLQVGDIVIINLPGNIGSFKIIKVNPANDAIVFNNLFATVGVTTQTDATQVKFFTPNKYVAFTNTRRAMTWETKSDQIVVEMPASPPVVKRSLMGSTHLNGAVSQMSTYNSGSSITLANADSFPNAGQFIIQPVNQIQNYITTPTENDVAITTIVGRLIGAPQKYTYTSRTALSTTGDITSGSVQIINLATTAGIAIGQNIKMVGIPAYSTVESIVGNTVNMTYPATDTFAGGNISFLGNTLTGISPNLPLLSGTNEFTLSTLSRVGNIVTGVTSSNHSFNVGDTIITSGSSGIYIATITGNTLTNSDTITNLSSTADLAPGMIIAGPGIPTGATIQNVVGTSIIINYNATTTATGVSITTSENLNTAAKILSVSPNTFTYTLIGTTGTASVAGLSRVENIGMASSGSLIICTDSVPASVSRVPGPYIWDQKAAFVLSDNTAATTQIIQAGKIVKLLTLTPNTIPAGGGYVIFDYGLNTQEGPVRYLYAPNSSTLALDPSYTFQYEHFSGAGVVAISHFGPHMMSGLGTEYPLYITDPTQARLTLENLILSVKSAGIFIDFLVRYPDEIYALYPTYGQ